MTMTEAESFDDELDDEEAVPVTDATTAFVTDTDWTTETILSQMRRGNIQLNPRFQRRDAWDPKRKSRFIESLVLGLPIPQIVLAEDKRRRGSFIVLDGKQRLLTLSQFAVGSSFGAVNPGDVKDLKLSGLDVIPNLTGLNLRALEEAFHLSDYLDSFLNQTIRTVVVRNWPDEAFLNLVFLRLNTGSVSLSPQELRQALHPGPFTDFLDDYASDSVPLQMALNNRTPDFRMRDVELLLRFFANKYFLPEYGGNLKSFLDTTSDRLNHEWDMSSKQILMQAREFDYSIEATFSIFGDDSFRRFSALNERFQPRFNRAVFEIMTHYFSEPEVRAAALDAKESVKYAYEKISSENAQFVEALQTSTKTPAAVQRRFGSWGEALSAAIQVDVPIPALERLA